jgi:hypothetical protein
MGLGGILQELKTEGVLALYHDYRSGRLVDYSGNGNNGTATSASFTKDSVRLMGLTGQVLIPYNVGLVSANISIIINACFTRLLSGDRIISRRGAASTFDWYHNTGLPGLTIFQDAGNRNITSTTIGLCRSIGLTMANGVPSKHYEDGVYKADYSALTSLAASTGDFIVGNFAGSSNLTGKDIGYVVQVNRALTATEHARVYGQLENMTWNTKGLTPGPMMP